ncbi:MAG: caspase family protein [Myxococcota bacterium]
MMQLVLVLGVLLAAGAVHAETKRWSVAIGANDGGPERELLRYATSDATSFAAVMQALGGVDEESSRLVLNGNRDEVATALNTVAEDVRAALARGDRTEIIVYYSGHSDEEGLLLGREQVLYATLRDWLDAIPADVRVAILDSCASGTFTRLKGGKRRDPLRVRESEVRGYAYVTSAAATEAAQESDRLGASFFTHFLISGLLGAADFSRDGVVTLAESYQFAYTETLARTQNTQSGAQHPAYDIQLQGAGQLVLTDLRARDSGFALGDDIAGRVFFNSSNKLTVAELRKVSGENVELSLPVGVYEIFVANGSQRWSGMFEATPNRRQPIALADLSQLDFEETFARGGPSPRLAGYRSARFDETPSRDARTELVLVQTVHGLLIGAEICLASDCDDLEEWTAVLGLAGGLGLGASLALSQDGVTPGQAAILNSGFLWGVWHGVAIQGAIDAEDFLSTEPGRFAESGYTSRLIAAQFGGMLGAHWLHEVFEPTAADVATVNTLGLWSGLVGFAAHGAVGFPEDDELVWLTALVASDVGAIAGGVLSRYYPISRSRSLVLNAGGLIGGLLGAGVGVLGGAEEVDDRTLYVAGGLGALTGLGLTAWLTRDWDWEVPGQLAIMPTAGGAMAGFGFDF